MYLLDTNVVSEIRKTGAGRADPHVVTWANRVDTDLTYISAITIQELEKGILLAERRDRALGSTLRSWLNDDVYQTFEGRVLPVDTAVARIAASLHVPNPAPVTDALIAATALSHAMAVVTRNLGDFTRFRQLMVLNPWEPTSSTTDRTR
ncbi:MAG: type II toxin-antitoxin system VapC family toxin [Acidimicrobiia bacterium]|nr:type II toxin-antitoxin system VapC family toxin [Acidimicrobiia bacterium]